MIETVPQIVDIEVAISPVSEPRFRFDFEDGGGLTIASWDEQTRTLAFDRPLPPGVAPNKRLSLAVSSSGEGGSTGQPYIIAAITGASSLTLVPDPDNPFPPSLGAGDRAYAAGRWSSEHGGPFSTAIPWRAAMRARTCPASTS